MADVFEATVGSLGKPYADGTPNLELKLSASCAAGQPFVGTKPTIVSMRVDGRNYSGKVLANKSKHDLIWFSPTLRGMNGKRTTLGRVLTAAGFSKNDTISLSVSGKEVEVRAIKARRNF